MLTPHRSRFPPCGQAYFANFGAGTVGQCKVNPADGTITTCTATASLCTQPASIVAPGNGFAYIPCFGSNNVMRCAISPLGPLQNCVATSASSFSNPYGIAFAGSWVFINNWSGNFVSRCTFSSTTNDITGCVNAGVTGVTLSTPSFNAVYGSYLYTTSSNGIQSIVKCSINAATGALSSCAVTGPTFTSPFGISVNTAGSYAYVVTRGSTVAVWACPITAGTGAFGTCVNTGATGLNGPYGIVVSRTLPYLYVSNGGSNTGLKCTVSGATVSGCVASSAYFNLPVGATTLF